MDAQALLGEPSAAAAMDIIPEMRHHPVAEAEEQAETPVMHEEYWSPIVFVATFWIFLSTTLLFGVYSPVTIELGPDSSLLVTASPLLVNSIKVEQLDEEKPGLVLYGLYKDPPLDVVTIWSKNHSIYLEGGLEKEWILLLNKGSQINVSYSVSSPSSSLVFIIAEGSQEYVRWREEPSYPNTTLSWNVIQGNGTIQQEIQMSSTYYVAVGNLNSEETEVKFNFKVKSVLYNTTEAYYSCIVANDTCSLKMLFPDGNAAVLTSTGRQQGKTNDTWYVRLSYGPRWTTYLAGVGMMTVLMFLAINLLNRCCNREEVTTFQPGEQRSGQVPLLSQKDDDLSSWGSSYDSGSQDDDDDLEDGLAVGSAEGKPKDGEYNANIRRLCAICYDAPRDCFFLPCGHCAACFACGTRIAELAGTCPICWRNFKKVRRIFTV